MRLHAPGPPTARVAMRGKEPLARAGRRGDHDGSLTRRRRMSFGLGETEPGEIRGGESGTIPAIAPQSHVTFERRGMRRLLRLYRPKGAAGGWGAFAVDFLQDPAVFSGFRRASAGAVFRIVKNIR